MDEKDKGLIQALKPIYSRVRTDVTAIKGSDGGMFWDKDGGPLNTKKLSAHLNGGPARGVAFIKAGGSVTSIAALDMDDHEKRLTWAQMAEIAGRIIETFELFDIYLIAFRSSGGRGIHLYAVWDAPQDAHSVRVLFAQALAMCGFQPGTKGVELGEVEVFPKQDSVPLDGFGNQVILPLAGKSVPLDEFCMPLDREHALSMQWPASKPVPVIEKESAELARGPNPARYDMVASALDAIPNEAEDDVDYDTFMKIMFGVVDGLGGRTDEARDLMIKFAKRNKVKWRGRKDQPKTGQAMFDHLWKSAKPGGKVTAASLFAIAAERGKWVHPAHKPVVATDDDFEDCDPEDEGNELPENNDTAQLPQVIVAEKAPDGILDVQDATLGIDLQRGVEGSLPNLIYKSLGTGANSRVAVSTHVSNLTLILARPQIVGYDFAIDRFNDLLMQCQAGTKNWLPADEETVYNMVRFKLERHPLLSSPDFKLSIADVKEALRTIAKANEFDSGLMWAATLKWDGVPRVRKFCRDYLGTADDEYHDAVSLYAYTAHAGRLMHPGTKADMMPVLVGGQGIGKSQAIKAIAPAEEYWTTISFSDKDADNVRKMRGKLVSEVDELQGMASREVQAIRSFLSKSEDNHNKKFVEGNVTYKRRCLFWGSTNEEQFLNDPAGNRRMLPIRPGVVQPIAVQKIKDDCSQLWAEAIHLFRESGVNWTAEKLAREVHGEFEQKDEAWSHLIVKAFGHLYTDMNDRLIIEAGKTDPLSGDPLDDPDAIGDEHVSAYVIARKALQMTPDRLTRAAEMKIGNIMKSVGWAKKRVMINGVRTWIYVRSRKIAVDPLDLE
jgi:hypothetical protein